MQEYITQFTERILAGLPNMLTALLIFLGSLYAARLLSKMLKNILQRRDADPEVTLLLTQLTRWSLIVIGLIAALQRFFDVTAFLAGLGILGFTVGFAMQDIMQNFVAGVILLIQQPFNVGDAIEVDKFGGAVLAINLRTTELRTWDGRIVIIPNANVIAKPIINFTRADRRRVDLSVGVSYDTNPAIARKVVLESIRDVPGFVHDPKPVVTFHTFASSSIDMTAYLWIDTSKTDLFAAKDAALELMKAALEKNGIEIPYPTTTVHMQT